MTAVLMIITHSHVNYPHYIHLGLSGSMSFGENKHAKKAADMIDSQYPTQSSIPYISNGDLRITATLDSLTISRGSN